MRGGLAAFALPTFFFFFLRPCSVPVGLSPTLLSSVVSGVLSLPDSSVYSSSSESASSAGVSGSILTDLTGNASIG